MQFKRYEVTNLQDAVVKIKKDLGPDAIILSTKKIAGRSPFIEVMAARDEKADTLVSIESAAPKKEERNDDLLSCLRQEFVELKAHLERLTQKSFLQKDLADIKDTMNVLFDNIAVKNAAHLRDIYITMIAGGMPRSKAVKIIETIKSDFPGEQRDTYEKGMSLAEKLIAGAFVKEGKRERRIKALIGPTGVGKTTTLAKLAAHYSLEKKLKVGLITTDMYRIAASEQLKIYAKIMDLPIKIASERNAFVNSLESFAEKDVILVDTPGRNPNDDQALNSLKTIFDGSVETVLLLNPVTNREYLLETADRFRMFNYDRIILTKIDECNRFGSVYDVIADVGIPVSHMTTGQNVPRDIEKTNPEKLAKLILKNRLN